jgi:glucokinase
VTLAIGVDVGGTKVAAGVVDEDGQIVAKLKRSTPAASPALTEQAIANVVNELLGRHQVTAIGLGAAGFVDSAQATMLFAPNLAWRDEPLKQRVEERLGRAVVVENDANASAWAEARFGAARGYRDVMLVAVGTGIGAAIIIGGELYRGRWGIAGEPGHVRVVPDGRLCGCGNRGCWEQYASGNALVAEAREFARRTPKGAMRLLQLGGGMAEGISGPEITQAATEGDPAALRCFQTVGGWLGQGLADLAAVLDPACFVIGGGVSEAGELLLDPARAAFERALTGRGHRPFAEIRVAQLGENAGIVGAADLAREVSQAPVARLSPPETPRARYLRLPRLIPLSRRTVLDHCAVVPVVRASGPRVVHAQHEDGEPGHERRDRTEGRQPRHLPARRGGYHQIARPAEQRRPGALGHRVQLGQRRRGRRDEVLLVVIRRRPVGRDTARRRPADPPRHLHHLRVAPPVGFQPPVPSGNRAAHPARLIAQFMTEPIEPVAAVRPGQAAVPAGRVPSLLAVGGMPPGLAVSRVPPMISVWANVGSPVLPVGPACPISLTSIVGLAHRLRRHVLAGGPGSRLLGGQRRIEPGHKVTPCRVLVALSALGVIPVRHVSTAAYRSLPSTIAVPGPVPGG